MKKKSTPKEPTVLEVNLNDQYHKHMALKFVKKDSSSTSNHSKVNLMVKKEGKKQQITLRENNVNSNLNNSGISKISFNNG